jgi:hypothetical protein
MSLFALMLAVALADEVVESAPALTDAQLAALREYRQQHFSVRTEVHTSGGGSRIWTPPPYAWGGVMITQDPITTTRTWAVYQGNERVDVPRFYELSDRELDAKDLVTRITMKRWLGRLYYGAAVGGVGAVLFSAVAVNATADDAQKSRYERLAGTGLGVAVVGLIGGSVPMATASRLETDYAVNNVDMGMAEDLVDAQNEALRVRLGLTPQQAFDVESRTPVMAPVSTTP